MKISIATSIAVLSAITSLAQTIPVTGTVSNQKGQPVPFAFVRDAQHNYATFADSSGSYKLEADPKSAISVYAFNYKDAQVLISDKKEVPVVLTAEGHQEGVVSMTSIKETINSEFLREGNLLFGGDNSQQQVKSGFTQEATRGSRYLYPDWIPGFGISKKDSLVVEITNMYNYDKVSGNIIYTNDGKSMAQVSPSQLKCFSLFDKKAHAHVYENVPAINAKSFVEVILNTTKYKIYKKVDTKLSRADFHTDGVLEMGHRYDEYKDNDRYYFIGADAKVQSISLKKSTLKKLLGADAETFIASQGSREVDDEYVKDLGSSLNK